MFTTDSGYIATGAERIVRGQVMFRDFFSELGPGTYYLQAGVFKLLGVSLAAVNVVVWLMGLGTSWLVYRLSKPVIDGWAAILPSFFFVAICYPVKYSLSHHWTGVFFLLLTLQCLSECVKHAGEWPSRRVHIMWFLAGLLSVVTLLAMQSKGVMAFVLAAAYLLIAGRACGLKSWREGIREVWKEGAWFVSGFIVAFGAVFMFFALHHAARAWLYDNFLFLPTNYWPYQNPPGTFWNSLIHPFLRMYAHPWFMYLLFVIGYYFFMLVGPAAVLIATVWSVRALRGSDGIRARLMLLYGLASFAALLSELHSLDLEHFVMGGVLVALVLTAGFQHFYRRNPQWRRAMASAAAVAAVFVVLGGGWQVAFTRDRNSPVETRRGTMYATPDDAKVLNKWISQIQSRVPAGNETFFFPYEAWLYFLTASHNPTRFDYVLPLFHTPAQINEVAETLLNRRPQFIFDFNPEGSRPELILTAPHPLESLLRSSHSPYRLERKEQYLEIWTLKK